MIDFIVTGNPKPQKRHRYVNRGKFVTIYDASRTDKNDFLMESLEWAPIEPWTEAVSVQIEYAFKRPASHFGTGKNANKLKPSAPEFHTKKCDLDNLAKLNLDALNGVFWADDGIIDELILNKKWSSGEGYTKITIVEPEDDIAF